jgi:NADPH2:quinone reductase
LHSHGQLPDVRASEGVKAVAHYEPRPVTDPTCLVDVDVPRPALNPRDLLVEIRAVSINPLDTKLRHRARRAQAPRILGYDAAGTVVQVGPSVSRFAVGDDVYYAGSIVRPGANSELHAVDERLVAGKPMTPSYAEAAVLPLTALTAWETLFERLGLAKEGDDAGRSLLVIGGGGGVGSMAAARSRVVRGHPHRHRITIRELRLGSFDGRTSCRRA